MLSPSVDALRRRLADGPLGEESTLSFAAILERSATFNADRTAGVHDGASMTYSQLFDRSSRLANGLIEMGLQPGDRVAVLGDNSLASLIEICGLAQAGLVRCPMYTQNTTDVHVYMLNLTRARCLIVQDRYYGELHDRLGEARTVEHVLVRGTPKGVDLSFDGVVDGSSPTPPRVKVAEDDDHIIRFSAGTTGRPKGIVHTNRGWLQMGNEFALALPRIDARDVQFVAGPMSHAAGLWVWPTIAAGASHAIMSSFNAAGFLELVERERATFGILVPTMIQAVVNHRDAAKRDVSSLRAVYYGAAPIAERTLMEARAVWGDVMYQVYGQSEALPITTMGPEDLAFEGEGPNPRLRSAGRATPNTLIRIVDEDGCDVVSGDAGEIAVKSPGAMDRIWDNPAATEQRTMPDGWVLTRDIGRLDPEGFLYIEDRKEDLIISGGFNIWPAEVENALFSHPSVREAAVVGVPHDKWGETPLAVVALRDHAAATGDELIAWCRERIGPVKKPTRVEFMDELPKSTAGKVLRRVLRDRYWEGLDRRVAGS
jgi:acyl-CoA synthetase (AMP-forming)/AMP-acid ligase II